MSELSEEEKKRNDELTQEEEVKCEEAFKALCKD